MKVHVIGPNLPDQSNGSFHVHAEGCADVKRNRDYRSPEFKTDRETTVDVADMDELVAYVYADQLAEDDSLKASDLVNDFYVFGCAKAL